MYDVAVIGGGAAGLTAAIAAAESGAKVCILEKNAVLGKKLSITGKGRCNLTNNCTFEELMENIPRNGKFLYSALRAFSPQDVMTFFESLGVPLKTERGKRVFPVSDKAADIVRALERRIKELNIEVVKDSARSLVLKNGSCVGVRGQREYSAGAVILATGGMSYPKTGSDGFGYNLAKAAGHTIIPPEPSLSAMETKQRWVAQAAGLDLHNISMTLLDGEKKIYEDFGELQFTAYGVSGPTVLSSSAHIPKMESERYSIKIDLKPALSEKQLDARIIRDFAQRRGMPFGESLRGLLPQQLTVPVTELSGIDSQKKVDEITREERRALVSLLKGIELEITRFRPIDEAIITRGGICIKEIAPKTMQSKLCSGLYFAGEIIDVDAYTGGFNLQIAFATGVAAGKAAAERV